MRYFLISFDCNGLECLQDITEHHPTNFEKTQLLEALKGSKISKNPLNQQIFQMKMRAQMNPQRNYEIYVQSADDGISAGDFAAAFNSNPQFWADRVREYHSVKIYSDRAKKGSRVIE
jgi:hypothetical protein